MPLPAIYFSRPVTLLPDTVMDNDGAVNRVKAHFTGQACDWEPIEAGIRGILEHCGTEVRYLEEDRSVSPGAFAAKAVTKALSANGITPSDVDLLVYGGIARENFEPSTAAEVCGRLGMTPVHAFDTTCACAGLIEALHVVAAQFALHDQMQVAVICSGEMFRDHIDYSIQRPDELATKVAGLTLGNAAAAFVVARAPLSSGSARLLGIRHQTLAEHYQLCYAPIDGHFTSHSRELFALASHVPAEIRKLVGDVGWTTQEVDHYAFHQPSSAIIDAVFDELDAKPDARIHTHALYANTASTAWALALDHRIRNGGVRPGDKLVLMSAAAGFTIGTAAAVWS